MHARGLSIRDLAALIPASRSAVGDWLCARRQPPLDLLERIADHLHLAGDARRELILAGHLTRCTPLVLDHLARLEAAAVRPARRSRS
jgi:transcriptional regulator with XRE-family HTH domain